MTIEGKFGIKATVLADSVAVASTNRLIAYEIEYPRIILAELNTHRALSKNSHSSRAIPFEKMKQQLTGRPVRFGAANPGMQDTGVDHDGPVLVIGNNGRYPLTAKEGWSGARESAIFYSEAFYKAGYAKQVYNRLTEPFQMMRTVISGTEWDNFFWLRDHGAADPTLQELARVMREAREASTPAVLKPGEWHLPYVTTLRSTDGSAPYYYLSEDDVGTMGFLNLDDAIKVSCARCAAVSFRNLDYGLEKCLEVYNRLVGDDRKHASAFEHQATPMKVAQWCYVDLSTGGFDRPEINAQGHTSTWEPGISHMDRDGNLWSGNLKGFIQYRKLIPGENYINH